MRIIEDFRKGKRPKKSAKIDTHNVDALGSEDADPRSQRYSKYPNVPESLVTLLATPSVKVENA